MVYFAIILSAIVVAVVAAFYARPFMWRWNNSALRKACESIFEGNKQIRHHKRIKVSVLCALGARSEFAEQANDYNGFATALGLLDSKTFGELDVLRSVFRKHASRYANDGLASDALALKAVEYAVNAAMLQKTARNTIEEAMSIGLQSRLLLLLWPDAKENSLGLLSE